MSHPIRRPYSVLAIVAAVGASLGAACGGDSNPADRASASPVLGRSSAAQQEGYGAAEPEVIDNGGDSTGRVSDITWDSWGGDRAIGHGTAVHVAEGRPTAEGEPLPATVVAFRLGACEDSDTPAYRAIDWYFPERGESFDQKRYIDACTGDHVGSR